MRRVAGLSGISALTLLACTSPAWAQGEDQVATNEEGTQVASTDSGVDEQVITVTATKRETELQETPIAITALGGDALEARQIDSAVDLATYVPGANFSTNGGATSITVRGVGSDGLSQPKDDPSVAAHIDGVYLARPASLGMLFYDIERVEVLRGPQGTLYGRNATGGALNIITKDPTGDFGAKGDVSYGNYDAVQLRGAVNIPLGDTLGFRASGIYDTHDGYSNQLNPAFEDGDDADDWGGRATLQWEPMSDLTVTLRANLFESNGVGQTRTLLDTRALAGVRDANGVLYGSTTGGIIVNRCALPGFPEACDDPRAIHTVYPDEQRIKSNTFSVSIEYDVSDAVTLRSITGYTDFVQDRDSSSRPFRPINFNASFDFITTSEAFTQEVNVAYDAGGPFTFVAGVFYLDDDGTNFFDQIAANPLAVASIESDQFATTKSVAGFGEANFEIVDGLNLTAGIRYTEDEKTGSSSTRVSVPFQAPFTVPLAEEVDFNSTDYKLGIDWEFTDDIFVYANYSTAFKSGGVNTGIPTNRFYQPEKLRAWQGGIRSEWFDRRFIANLDLYHYKYKNPQITQVLGTSLETQNASSAKSSGAELSLEARPIDGLFVGGHITYSDSEYGPGLITDIIDVNQFGQNVFGRVQIGGNPLRFTPEWTLGINAAYTVPLSDSAEVTFRGDYSWQDDATTRPHNLPIVDQISSYSQLNAGVRLDFADGKYFAEIFGRNLTNERVISARFVNPLHLVEYRAPRTYGVSVGFNFE